MKDFHYEKPIALPYQPPCSLFRLAFNVSRACHLGNLLGRPPFSFLLVIIPAPLFAQDLTIYDKNQQVMFDVRDGKIYNANQRLLGTVHGDRKSAELYDPRSKILGHVRNGKLYDKNWRLLGMRKKGWSMIKITEL
jgi:hypothetical protein